MKILTKKILSISTVFVLLVCFYSSTVLSEQSFDIIKAKQNLAKCYSANYRMMSQEEQKERSKEVNEKLLKLIAENNSSDKIDDIMSNYKVYRLNVPIESPNVYQMDSAPNNAICNAVSIYYDSTSAHWIVVGGGWWTSNNWVYDIYPWFVPYYGETHNCGGLDSVGITYNNTSGVYNTSVVSSMGYMTDQNGWGEYSYSPSHGNGASGVAFDFQDKHKSLTNNPFNFNSSTITYFGKGYSALIEYNSNFSNYNGYARTFYAHTWSSCQISNISFGGSGSTYGVTVTFSTSDHCWKIFNNSDTQF